MAVGGGAGARMTPRTLTLLLAPCLLLACFSCGLRGLASAAWRARTRTAPAATTPAASPPRQLQPTVLETLQSDGVLAHISVN